MLSQMKWRVHDHKILNKRGNDSGAKWGRIHGFCSMCNLHGHASMHVEISIWSRPFACHSRRQAVVEGLAKESQRNG